MSTNFRSGFPLRILLLVLLHGLISRTLAQSTLPKAVNDSLWAVWNNPHAADTSRLSAMLDIAWDGYVDSQPDSAFYYAQLMYDLAERKELKKPMASALNCQGKALRNRGDLINALDHYTRSLKIQEELGNKARIAVLLINIGIIHLAQGDHAQANDYYTRSLKIQEELGNKAGIARALGNIGTIYDAQGDHAQAMDYYTRSLKINEEIGDKTGIAGSLNNIGVIHQDQGDHAQAIDYYTRSLKIQEELGNKAAIARALNNIGAIYKDQGDHAQAMDYHTRSLKIQEELGNKAGIAMSLSNIGNGYRDLGDRAKALDHYTRSLKIREELGDKSGIATTLNNIGDVYLALGDRAKALDHYTRSLKINEEIGNKSGIAASLNSLGMFHQDQGDHAKAVESGTKGMRLAQEVGHTVRTRDLADLLYHSYKALDRPDSALLMYELYITMRDSILSEENQKEVMRQRFQYDYEKKELAIQKEMELSALRFAYEKKQAAARTAEEKQQLRFEEELKRTQLEAGFAAKQAALEAEQQRKEELAKAEQEKKDAVAAEELRRKNVQRNAFIGGFGLMLLLAGVFFVQRNRINKEKQRSEELLLNILPQEVAEELKAKGSAEAVHIDQVTVLFTDFKGFTAMSETLSPQELVRDLNECFSAFDHITAKYGIEKIKTIGDAYMAAGGLPTPNTTHATDVIKAAFEMRDLIAEGKARKIAAGLPFFEIRIGVHTGPVVAGIVGVKKFQYDIWGDTVNIASRMESSGEVGQVNISEATYALVKDVEDSSPLAVHSLTTVNEQLTTPKAFKFTPRGKVQAKGKGEMEMYFVER